MWTVFVSLSRLCYRREPLAVLELAPCPALAQHQQRRAEFVVATKFSFRRRPCCTSSLDLSVGAASAALNGAYAENSKQQRDAQKPGGNGYASNRVASTVEKPSQLFQGNHAKHHQRKLNVTVAEIRLHLTNLLNVPISGNGSKADINIKGKTGNCAGPIWKSLCFSWRFAIKRRKPSPP